jgi:hypothetical protein
MGVLHYIKFRLTKVFIISSLLSLMSAPLAGQPDCSVKVENYLRRFKSALQNFIPDPGSDAARDQYLNSLNQDNPQLYGSVVQLSMEANRNMRRDALWLSCFQQEFLSVEPSADDEKIVLWSAHLFKKFAAFAFLSPEFEKGIGIHVDASQGAADLGADSETYSFATRILLSYTFSNEVSGGRFRVLGGLSTYYFDRKFVWFANPRLEARITDIGNDLTTFGNIKAIVDANFGKTWIIGAGIAVELHNFGVQMMYQRQGETKNSHILVGLFYRFLK